MGIFQTLLKGQLTPQYVIESCRISNLSEILKLSSLPARMKNEEDPIKNEGARVLTRLYIVFSSTARSAKELFVGSVTKPRN